MENSASARTYFLYKSGRITGPFALERLQRMLRAGELSAEEQFSLDKLHWKSMAELFPQLAPPPPPLPAAEEKQEDFAYDDYALKESPRRENCAPAAEVVPELPEVEEYSVSFFSDLGRTIALIWNSEEIFPEICGRSGRIFGIAGGLNLAVFTVTALLFSSGNRLLSAVAAWGLLAVLVILLLIAGKLVAFKNCFAEWLNLGAAYLMSYGMIAGCAIAWSVAGNLYLGLMLGFIASAGICSAVIQTMEFIRQEQIDLPCRMFLQLSAVNGAVFTAIYFFTKWI